VALLEIQQGIAPLELKIISSISYFTKISFLWDIFDFIVANLYRKVRSLSGVEV